MVPRSSLLAKFTVSIIKMSEIDLSSEGPGMKPEADSWTVVGLQEHLLLLYDIFT